MMRDVCISSGGPEDRKVLDRYRGKDDILMEAKAAVHQNSGRAGMDGMESEILKSECETAFLWLWKVCMAA